MLTDLVEPWVKIVYFWNLSQLEKKNQMLASRYEKCKTRGIHGQVIRMKRSISGEG